MYKDLRKTPRSPLGLYQYYNKRYLFVQVILSDIKEFYPGEFECSPAEADTFEPMFYKIISADMNRICVDAACCAWLSWDNKSLADFDLPAEQVPECLSYGLVLEYPRPLIRGASFLAGYTRREELLGMSEHIHNQADLFALQQVRGVFPELTQEDYNSLIDPYRNSCRKHLEEGIDPSCN
jgi:hypothetical protein